METDEAPPEAMTEVALEDPKPVFKVERRALKTFRILFYDPDVTSTPGEVPWNNFLHALTSVGLAAEKLYGSVWQFSPYTLEANGSIHFHEPHPHNKVPFVIARRHGRRLYRTYGWTGEQFVLDKATQYYIYEWPKSKARGKRSEESRSCIFAHLGNLRQPIEAMMAYWSKPSNLGYYSKFIPHIGSDGN
ncbi:unnamed protein product [Fusarium fujikuroi]|nr:unnamed protein product [Fusarium fujikuroi]VTT84374.1 unnamed protein product [Fusarium fujikuroi]VZI08844.1 unnamed protein product [Fusarium fujikuroi]